MAWDWSQAGDAKRKDDPHEYLKIKGTFEYEESVVPEYAFYDGHMDRYLMGDKTEPGREVAVVNQPRGIALRQGREAVPVQGPPRQADPRPGEPHPPAAGHERRGRLLDEVRLGARGEEGRGDGRSPVQRHVRLRADPRLLANQPHDGPREGGARLLELPRREKETRLDWVALGYERDPAGGKRHVD